MDTSIVTAIAALADSLDPDVVAEGIETMERLTPVRLLGCAFGQEFLWSPGLPADGALAWAVDNDKRTGHSSFDPPNWRTLA